VLRRQQKFDNSSCWIVKCRDERLEATAGDSHSRAGGRSKKRASTTTSRSSPWTANAMKGDASGTLAAGMDFYIASRSTRSSRPSEKPSIYNEFAPQ